MVKNYPAATPGLSVYSRQMTRAIEAILCAILFLSGCADGSEEASKASIQDRISSAEERLDLAAADGASGILRITIADRVLLESGFGSASCADDEPTTPAHVFMIGSITKEFTQLLGYVLEEQGAFALDDTVSKLLPEFRGPVGQVTLQQLIDHTGGLPDIIDENGRSIAYTVEYDYEPVSREQLIARAELVKLKWEPGQDEHYSNLGYQLLAAIYEVATGKTYPDLLRRYVYQPAGMEHTDFWFSDTQQRSFADGCRTNNRHWGNPIEDQMWDSAGPSWNLIGAGGLLSTAESLGRFFAGIGDGVYFDDPAQLEKYKSARLAYSKKRQQRVMGPAGSNGIFNAAAFWADDDRFNVIMMTNRADHPAEDGLIQDILRLFPAESFTARDQD